jgi:hypothetical protein
LELWTFHGVLELAPALVPAPQPLGQKTMPLPSMEAERASLEVTVGLLSRTSRELSIWRVV